MTLFLSQIKRNAPRFAKIFDFGTLRLCIDEIIPHGEETHPLGELSKRKSLFDKIIFFNNNLSYLDLVGLQFTHYYNLFVAESDNGKKSFYDVLFKQAYRNMCVEIKVLEEKIKDFLRFVYNFNPESTKYTDDFLEKLEAKLSETDYGKILWKAIERYWQNANIKKITDDRNDEIHNETTLLTSLDADSATNNASYFNTIKGSLIAIYELKNSFQNFLIKVYPDIKILRCVI